MDEITVRVAADSDAGSLSELADQLGYDRSADDIAAWLGKPDEARIVLVAEIGGMLVGWIQAQDTEFLQYSRYLEIAGLVVADGQRGRGIGRHLVDAATDWGRRRGHSEVRVRSNVTRSRAHGFYESLGFARVKTSYTFARRLDDSP